MNADLFELALLTLDARSKKPKDPVFAGAGIKKAPSKTFSYTERHRGQWFKPEYNLEEIQIAQDRDSYIFRTVQKKTNRILTAGWELVSRNEVALNYLKNRLVEMELATNKPFDLLLAETVADLIRYSNCMWIKVRNRDASSGKVRIDNGTEIDPIAGYYVLPFETLRFKTKANGEIKKVMQKMPTGNLKEFAPIDLIHWFSDRKPGFSIGTPGFVPALDDIALLRRIEENIEELIESDLFPLFHYQIGSDAFPERYGPDGIKESDVVRSTIEYMPAGGIIVTDHRHKIEAIGSEGRALRIENYLQYFKQRALVGVSMSALDFGEGDSANRCFDESTQVLTSNGWKYWWEFTNDLQIATIHPETHMLEFQNSTSGLLLYDYNGKMLQIKNQLVDQLVTPNHKLYTGRHLWNKKRAWELKEFNEIKTDRFDFLTTSTGLDTPRIEVFELPTVLYSLHCRKAPNANISHNINMDDWLEFLGYFISEGTLAKTKGRWAVSISQSRRRNSFKTDKIRSCLEKLPFKYSEYYNDSDGCSRFWIHSKSLWLYLASEIGMYSNEKHIPRWAFSLPTEQVWILFNALLVGDGSLDKRSGRSSGNYSSNSDALLDDVLELCLRLGIRASITSKHHGVGRVCFSKFQIAEVKTKDVISVDYTGKVWCFEVPNHLLVTRRNGKVCVSGNSTASTMSKAAIQDIEALQFQVKKFLEFYVFNELLLEGPFDNSVLLPENRVEIKFGIIDKEDRARTENQTIQKWLNNTITLPEVRKELGYPDMTEDDRELTFFKLIEEPLALLKAASPGSAASEALGENPQSAITPEAVNKEKKFQTEIQKSKGITGRPATKSKAGSAAKASSAKSRPQNQRGTRAAPKFTHDEFLWSWIIDNGLDQYEIIASSNIQLASDYDHDLASIINMFERRTLQSDEQVKYYIFETMKWRLCDLNKRYAQLLVEIEVKI